MNEEKKINIEDDNNVELENEQNVTEETQDAATQENAESTEDSENKDSQEEMSPLEKAEEEIKSLTDKYLRAVAEFENYRKRTLKEKAELILNGSEKTITAILPVLDDFERAIADNTEDAKAIKEGMEVRLEEQTVIDRVRTLCGIWFNVRCFEDRQGLLSGYRTTPLVCICHNHAEGSLAKAVLRHRFSIPLTWST